MARGRKSDKRTGDLFAQPPRPAITVDPERVRADTVAQRASRAVAMALADCDLGRGEIAERMSDYLGESVSKAMLDAYASPARDEHRINIPRLLALMHATGDVRPLAALAETLGYAVVERRQLEALHAIELLEARADIDRQVAKLPANLRSIIR